MNSLLNIGENRHLIERSPATNNDCPIFSAMCLQIFVKNDRFSPNDNDHDKYSALDQVKEMFKCLIDFFYTNKIAVCFGFINTHRGSLTNIPSLLTVFKTPLQIYAFTMLKNVGYSIEEKISQQKSIRDSLLELSNNDDDKFYRLCLYLFRRATEYHFLNVSNLLKRNILFDY